MIKNNEYCFQVKENNLIIFEKTSSEIEVAIKSSFTQLNDMKDYLIAGIGIWLLLK